MRRVAIALATLLVVSAAHADETDACFSAPVDGQQLKKDGKLRASLERFETCARKSCPAEIVADCARWASEVENAIPSIVIAARDAQGADLTNVRVAIDDGPPSEVSARAIALDPGSHKLVFSREGAAPIEQNILLREGEKDRQIIVRFAPPPSLAVAPPPVVHTVETRPVPASAWIALAIGAAALGGFATVGALGVSERSSDGCDVGCTQAQKDDVDLKFHVADALLGVGIVGVAVAAIIYLTRGTVTRVAPSTIAVRF